MSKSQIDIDSKTEAVLKRKNYKILNKLGAGAFGTVYKAERISKAGEYAAVKVLDLTKMTPNYRSKFLPRELQTLIETKHENIIEVFDIIRSNKKLYIFMEFAGGGDISGYVRKHDGVRLQLGCIWFLQISHGLTHLHEVLGTCHRDIKLDNMLLNEKCLAKLSDFGFARVSVEENSGSIIMSKTYCGTLPYYSPQLLKRVPYDPFKTDVWSMGVSLYILLHNRFPFHHKDRKVMTKEMTDFPAYIKSRYTPKTPEGGKQLLQNMLNPDEAARIQMKEVVKNDWLVKTANSSSKA